LTAARRTDEQQRKDENFAEAHHGRLRRL
jgi:hypothetical protein